MVLWMSMQLWSVSGCIPLLMGLHILARFGRHCAGRRRDLVLREGFIRQAIVRVGNKVGDACGPIVLSLNEEAIVAGVVGYNDAL